MIRRFPEEGITVLVSSHILSEIAQTADYIGIIANGVLGYQGGMPEMGHLEELFMTVAARYAVPETGCGHDAAGSITQGYKEGR